MAFSLALHRVGVNTRTVSGELFMNANSWKKKIAILYKHVELIRIQRYQKNDLGTGEARHCSENNDENLSTMANHNISTYTYMYSICTYISHIPTYVYVLETMGTRYRSIMISRMHWDLICRKTRSRRTTRMDDVVLILGKK